MRKYRHAIVKNENQLAYNKLIQQKKDDGTFFKIKKAEKLRGQVNIGPTDPRKATELDLYKSLEPILYLEPHRKL